MMNNKESFLDFEGNEFFKRNKKALCSEEHIKDDILLKKISEKKLENLNILEIGCCQGWRLRLLQKMFPTCKYYGLDPSQQGIDEGNNYPNNTISFSVGTCDDINIYENDKFDIVMVPFVFMYIDRGLLLKSVSEIDRVLKNNGKLIITDFYSNRQRKNPYKYIENTFIYKQNWFEIFQSSKNYFLESIEVYSHNTINGNDGYDNTCFYVEMKKDLINLFN